MKLRHINAIETNTVYLSAVNPFLMSKNAVAMDFIQHGKTTCLEHCMGVAYYSLLAVNLLRIKCDQESLVRGALLHDYFLYDWHEKDRSHSLHGFRHPQTALKNALQEYNLNPVERDIIIRHMFPLVPIPPRYIESMVVCVIDKLCSILEIFYLDPYWKMPDTRKALCK